MGSGIAKQVKEKFPSVYTQYLELYNIVPRQTQLLGFSQPCGTDMISKNNHNTIIMNLFAQENFGYDGKCYTDYAALRRCLDMVKYACSEDTIVAIPYLMGCHRGGGDWNVVYKMIEEVFSDFDGEVLICEYSGG